MARALDARVGRNKRVRLLLMCRQLSGTEHANRGYGKCHASVGDRCRSISTLKVGGGGTHLTFFLSSNRRKLPRCPVFSNHYWTAVASAPFKGVEHTHIKEKRPQTCFWRRVIGVALLVLNPHQSCCVATRPGALTQVQTHRRNLCCVYVRMYSYSMSMTGPLPPPANMKGRRRPAQEKKSTVRCVRSPGGLHLRTAFAG